MFWAWRVPTRETQGLNQANKAFTSAFFSRAGPQHTGWLALLLEVWMLFSEFCLEQGSLNTVTCSLSRILKEVVLWVLMHFFAFKFQVTQLLGWKSLFFFFLFGFLWKPVHHLSSPVISTKAFRFWTTWSQASHNTSLLTSGPFLPASVKLRGVIKLPQRVMSIGLEDTKP